MKNQNFRSQQGSMLVLMIAFTATVVLAVLFFALGFVRLTGTQFEQKTAIEAAALAAAREMSNIVVINDDFGYVGLSDSAPVGTDTATADNYYNQVHGINTLMGTTLLDYIIGKTIDNDELKDLAYVDFQKAIAAADQLQVELQRCTAAGQTAVDKDGNVLNPYLAAENAYRSNQVRIAGKSNYKANSMKLSLGAVDGNVTNIRTPRGWGGSFNAGATKGGYYASYKPVVYDGKTWVFAGVGDSMKLLDPNKFIASASGVPYQHRTIVRAEAVQDMTDGLVASTKSVAVAQPASVYDPKPAPGALVISFPDGAPDGDCAQTRLSDLYIGTCLADGNDDSDVYIASTGDYPVDSSSTMAPDPNWPIPSDPQQQANNACKIAIYDWIKRAGTKANVAAVVAAQNQVFNPASPLTVVWPPGIPGAKPIPNGVAHIFKFTPAGTVSYQSKQCDPAPFYVVSDQQMLVESFEVLTNGAASPLTIKPIDLGPPIMDTDGEVTLTKKFDLYIRDYGRRPGKVKGGKHSGEPMDDPLVSHRGKDSQLAIRLSNDGTGFGSTTAPALVGAAAKSRSQGGGGGSGSLPMILPQEDFAFYWSGSSMQILRTPGAYKQFQAGSGVRSTYQVSGVIADIRFRRQVQVKDENSVEIPVVDPVSGAPVIDPVTGAPTTTPGTVSTKTDIGYIGLK